MEKPSQQQVDELLRDVIFPFYDIERDMYIPDDEEGGFRFEKDAEHSWSVSLVACTLAPHIDPNLDVGLVAQFGLVHDLVEIYAGDTSVWSSQEEISSKSDKEASALQKIKAKFSHFPWLIDTIERYEAQDTNEARYVRAIDKYVALSTRYLNCGDFYIERGITHENFNSGLVEHRKKAHLHTGVAEYYDQLRKQFDENPQLFAPKDSDDI